MISLTKIYICISIYLNKRPTRKFNVWLRNWHWYKMNNTCKIMICLYIIGVYVYNVYITKETTLRAHNHSFLYNSKHCILANKRQQNKLKLWTVTTRNKKECPLKTDDGWTDKHTDRRTEAHIEDHNLHETYSLTMIYSWSLVFSFIMIKNQLEFHLPWHFLTWAGWTNEWTNRSKTYTLNQRSNWSPLE